MYGLVSSGTGGGPVALVNSNEPMNKCQISRRAQEMTNTL